MSEKKLKVCPGCASNQIHSQKGMTVAAQRATCLQCGFSAPTDEIWNTRPNSGNAEGLIEKIKKLPEAEKHTYWDEMPDGSKWNDGDDGTYCIDRYEVIKIVRAFA